MVGRSTLKWSELEDVLLDVELALNNRPLSYVHDDVQMPILTPNIMIFGQPNHIPEEGVGDVCDKDLHKRAKYLQKCKDSIWKRWTNEYLCGLRERHNMTHQSKELHLERGDVVLIRGDERNRGRWKIGIVDQLIIGIDAVVRGSETQSGEIIYGTCSTTSLPTRAFVWP